MLFDIRGRRRRLVQVTYLGLALLMGGGLVFFGIGGDVSGGLFDAFSERGGAGDPNSAIEQRVERLEKRLRTTPDDPATLQALVRDNYQLAVSQQESGQTQFPEEAKDELRKAGSSWQRYMEAVKGEPSSATATFALRVYDVNALNQPKEAQEAASIIAGKEDDAASYLQLVAYASLAGDKRTADLATQKAVDLAPQAEKKNVKQQAEALQKQSKSQAPSG
jgi:hypothetical protein